MAFEVAVPLIEEEIRSMVYADEGIIDPRLEESFQILQSEVSMLLQDNDGYPTVEQLDWVDFREERVLAIRDAMDETLQALKYGLAVFAGKAGEEALVSELRRQSAWCDVRRAEADALVADAGRLRDGCLRAMAGTEVDDPLLVMTAAEAFLYFLAKEMDGGRAPEADAARADAIDAAARAGNGVGARFAETFGGLAEKLRRHAEAYATGEDAAVAEGLRQRAAEVETLCADPEALVQRMLATESWRFWRLLNRHAGGITPTQSCMPAAPEAHASASSAGAR